MSEQPTQKQIDTLARFGIAHTPLSKRQCARLISFIVNGGPGFEETDPGHRANMFLKNQREWNGKRVRHGNGCETGTVRYVFVPSPVERESRTSLGVGPGDPFQAVVKWDERKACAISLTSMALTEK